eukprot:18278-Heterococcus_DN1.PRE.7
MAGTWVFYYVQGDEGESVGALNALKVKAAASDVRLRQFLDALPRLDGGASAPTTSKFHCRFKVADPISGYAWLDVTDPAAVLPQHEDMICAKLLRLDALPKPHPSRLRRKP